MTVAQTILTQLGGLNALVTMTGAKGFLNHGNGVSFKLPANFAKAKINYCKIVLTAADLYEVTFMRLWGYNEPKVIAVKTGVCCETLAAVFTEATGLELKLPIIRRAA